MVKFLLNHPLNNLLNKMKVKKINMPVKLEYELVRMNRKKHPATPQRRMITYKYTKEDLSEEAGEITLNIYLRFYNCIFISMTSTPHNVEFGVADALGDGYIRDWYDKMNSVLKRSEVFSNSYTSNKTSAVEGIGNIKEGAKMRFNVEADDFRMVNINTTYITFKQRVKVEIPAYVANSIKYYFLGYEHFAAAIKSYRLLSNNVPFLTVDHANFEWKLMYNTYSDEAIENSAFLTKLKKVREMNPTSAGIFIDVSGYTTTAEHEFDIHVMIPLHSFCILTDLRWIHDWMGRLRIEITPTYENLVIAPVIPQSKLNRPSKIMDALDTYNNNNNR
jgi:hypothetical protein